MRKLNIILFICYFIFLYSCSNNMDVKYIDSNEKIVPVLEQYSISYSAYGGLPFELQYDDIMMEVRCDFGSLSQDKLVRNIIIEDNYIIWSPYYYGGEQYMGDTYIDIIIIYEDKVIGYYVIYVYYEEYAAFYKFDIIEACEVIANNGKYPVVEKELILEKINEAKKGYEK